MPVASMVDIENGIDDFIASPEHRQYRRQKSIRAISWNRVDYVANERLNVIQKNPAPAHKPKGTQEWLTAKSRVGKLTAFWSRFAQALYSP